MSGKESKPEIWTPPEHVDQNTQRMAWLLFLETWKAEWHKVIEQPKEALDGHAEFTYKRCLVVAKVVRRMEQEPQ